MKPETGTLVGAVFVGFICLWLLTVMSITPKTPSQRSITSFIVGNNPQLPAEYAERLGKLLVREAGAAGVDPASLIAVAAVENHFWPNGKSEKGALGVMQVMPFWTKDPEWKHIPERLLHDPETSIKVGAHIIKKYRQECGGVEEGFACYVAGPVNMKGKQAQDYAKKVMNLRSKLCSVEPLFCNTVANSSV